jgi:HPt (histidine-containing phosphotransfer) domain-containing protein
MDQLLDKPLPLNRLEQALRLAFADALSTRPVSREPLPLASASERQQSIARLQELTGCDITAAASLFDALCESLHEDIDRLRTAAQARDPEAALRITHRITGATASLGQDALNVCAKRLRQAALGGDTAAMLAVIIETQEQLRVMEQV